VTRRFAQAALVLALCAAPVAARADDEEGSNSEDDKRLEENSQRRDPQSKHKRTKDSTAEEELAEEKKPESLSRLDDPHIGLSAEAAFSMALLNKSNGPGYNASGGFGLRVDWSVGRLWSDPADEFWKFALLAELAYDYVGGSEGTQAISTSTGYHFINLRGLFGWPVKDFFLIYGALGGGLTVESIGYNVQGTQTSLTGTKPDFDYGAGGRFRFALNPSVAISGRLELMRFRRGYLDDTFFSLTVGADF
jgi:hypothetical protein